MIFETLEELKEHYKGYLPVIEYRKFTMEELDRINKNNEFYGWKDRVYDKDKFYFMSEAGHRPIQMKDLYKETIEKFNLKDKVFLDSEKEEDEILAFNHKRHKCRRMRKFSQMTRFITDTLGMKFSYKEVGNYYKFYLDGKYIGCQIIEDEDAEGWRHWTNKIWNADILWTLYNTARAIKDADKVVVPNDKVVMSQSDYNWLKAYAGI